MTLKFDRLRSLRAYINYPTIDVCMCLYERKANFRHFVKIQFEDFLLVGEGVLTVGLLSSTLLEPNMFNHLYFALIIVDSN